MPVEGCTRDDDKRWVYDLEDRPRLSLRILTFFIYRTLCNSSYTCGQSATSIV